MRDEEITSQKVKSVYNKIMFLNHPDRGGSAEETAAINRAKKILLDPVMRADYIKVSVASVII